MGLVPLARAPETAKFVPTGNPTKCSDGSTSKPILFASTSTARGPLLNPLSKGGLLRNPNSGREARLPVSDKLSPNTTISLKDGAAVLPIGNRSQTISRGRSRNSFILFSYNHPAFKWWSLFALPLSRRGFLPDRSLALGFFSRQPVFYG